jgi:zinc D-Ala-D-Ala dipeptidase
MFSPLKPIYCLRPENSILQKYHPAFLFFICIFIFACSDSSDHSDKNAIAIKASSFNNTPIHKALPIIELEMISAGLVDITTIDSNIAVNMKYASTLNFLKINFYGDLKKAYLQRDVALKLSMAQSYLKEKHPGYSLLIYDAARPVHIQQQIWDSVKLPAGEKTKFVSNPKYGSLHNFGAAVDLTIIDENKKELDMGCTYDTLNSIAHPVMEAQNLAAGLLNLQQINNRKLLREVMYMAGFYNIQTEWWHFNSCRREEALKNYKIIE